MRVAAKRSHKVETPESRLLALLRIATAARQWREVYLAWVVQSEFERDLAANGENAALSELLDALELLDRLGEFGEIREGREA